MGFASPFGVASHCIKHCRARVAQGIQAVLTYVAHTFLPVTRAVCILNSFFKSKYARGSRLLPDLTGHFTTQADVGHATPLSVSGKPFRLTFILLSVLVRFTV